MMILRLLFVIAVIGFYVHCSEPVSNAAGNQTFSIFKRRFQQQRNCRLNTFFLLLDVLLCDHCESLKMSNCDTDSGPGYCSPQAAIQRHKREEILYVVCVSLDSSKPDYLSVVDVNPQSAMFSKVISRLYMPKQQVKDELHHFGWNTCMLQLLNVQT